MSLAAGTHLGAYEIVSPIGKGGMGEVYKARDTRLDRTVAIKVLPAELSRNEERRLRFEREARAVSSLNHPNICTLYEFGHETGVDFMAMEYLEGDTLAERLDKGALTVEDALLHGRALADALQRAHRHGVVHRDLKPGNIIITKTGAKLLDFGLSTRLRQGGEASVDVSAMTEAKPLTQEGTILGTFQYMAPEQLEGKEADARTDLFALGAVLYEMLTGQRAFQGKTQASLITAIMSVEPPAPSTLRPVTPRRLDEVLARCLAKDPDDRWQSAGDLSWELGRVTEAEVPEKRARSSNLPWIVAALAAAAAVALGVNWQRALSQPKPLIKSSLLAPEGAIDAHYIFALSPDGRHVAFEMKDAEGRDVLAVRSLDALEPRVLEGTVGAHYPFWSPDSSTIGFFVGGRLKKIPLTGGPTQTVCEITAAGVVSGTWNEDGVILLGSSTGPIFRVPASGGAPTAVTALDPNGGDTGHMGPQFLPDGEHFLYQKRTKPDDRHAIFVTSLEDPGTHREVVEVSEIALVGGAVIVEPGVLVFVGEGRNVFAQRFDPDALTPTGAPVAITDNVPGYDGYVGMSVTADVLVVLGEPADGPLVWRDRSGSIRGDLGERWAFGLSHEGRQVAATGVDLDRLVLLDTDGAGSATALGRIGLDPAWSMDDRHIVYTALGPVELIQKTVGTEGARSLKNPTETTFFISDWSPDGSTLALSALNQEVGGSYGIFLYDLESEDAVPFLDSEFNESNGVFSPDGRFIAYQSDESGQDNIYVRPLEVSRSPVRISTNGGLSPEWRQDGRELFYMKPNGTIVAVPVEGPMSFGEAVELFRVVPKLYNFQDLFDVTPDGERFLIMESAGPPIPLTVIQNWTQLLEQ